MHKIQLVIGDWSHDGHCHTRNEFISSNLSKTELVQAVKHSSVLTSVDFSNICSDYTNDSFDEEDFYKLLKFGLNPDLFPEMQVHASTFVDLWIWFVKLSRPDAVIELIDKFPTINIGGYGLFYD